MAIYRPAEIIKQALLLLGCQESVFSNFDTHSPIAVSFKDRLDINIELIDDRLWIYVHMEKFNPHALWDQSGKILEHLIEQRRDWIENGYPVLAKLDGGRIIEFRAGVVQEAARTPEGLASALNEFFTESTKIEEWLGAEK